MPAELGGVYALLLTPFHRDGAVDWAGYERYVDWQVGQRPHALFAVCGSSEMRTLTFAERLRLAEVAVERSGGLPVVATANLADSPADHPAELRAMERTGVAAVVLTTRGLGADQPALLAYLRGLAGAASVPVLVYEYPGYPHPELSARSYGTLVADGAVVGVKDTTCTLAGIRDKIAAAPGSLVLQANNPLLSAAIRGGAAGTMTITSTVAAGVVRRLWDELAAGDPAASATQAELSALDALLSGGYPATAKELLRARGLPVTAQTRVDAAVGPAQREALHQWAAWRYGALGAPVPGACRRA